MLLNEQIQQYENDGFLVVNDIFTEEEITELMQAFESPEIQGHFMKKHDGFSYFLVEITKIHDIFLKYAAHPKIINRIKPFLGEDIQLHHSKLSAKMPGENRGQLPLHQDYWYLPHTNTSLLAVMICLVDFNRENGCMHAIRGSHKRGVIEESDVSKLENRMAQGQDVDKQYVMPKRGGISIHHCLTLHGSEDNTTTLPRYSLVFQYRARDAYQLSSHIFDETGLVVSGKGHDEPLQIKLDSASILLTNSKFNPLINRSRCGNFSDDAPYGNAFNQYGQSITANKLVLK